MVASCAAHLIVRRPMIDSTRRLDETNVQLGKELWLIHSSLAVYRVIGLNARQLASGGALFGFVQNQALSAVALGLGKVFEREQPGTHELCSVTGVYRLAKEVPVRDTSAASAFAKLYGVTPSADWIHDVDQVLCSQRPRIQRHMSVIDRVRNTRLAHIQQMASDGILPNIAAFEELLAFAVAFHSFINEAFLSVHSHPILSDRQVEDGLLRVLRLIGVADPLSRFPGV